MTRGLRLGLPGAIVFAVGLMGARGRLPRNPFAGIRLPSTMRSDEAWLAGHHAAAPALMVAGSGPLAIGAVAAVRPSRGGSDNVLVRIGNAWLLGWLGVATVLASRAARGER